MQHVITYRSAQVGDVASGQQIVDVDQELLVDDLVVCEDEHHGGALDARLGVQRQQVSLEVRHAIAAANRDLEDLVAAQEGRQPASAMISISCVDK